MNLDRTIGNIFPKWPAVDTKRFGLVTITVIAVLIILIWIFSGPVKAQGGEILRRMISYPTDMTLKPPLLSDPVIYRLAAGGQISADGRTLVFTGEGDECLQPCHPQVIIEDITSGEQEIASMGMYETPADGEAVHPSISRDGRFVAYSSTASNLVTKDTNVASDIFLYDRSKRQNQRISQAVDGALAEGDSFSPVLSANGRFVTFVSYAENLVAGDTNKVADVFLADLEDGTTKRLTVNPFGGQANRDAHNPVISADGKIVVFSSVADNLVADDTNTTEDIFAIAVDTGEIIRLSLAKDGSQADGDSFDAALSADGRLLAYASYATNLGGEENTAANVFLYDALTQKTRCVSCETAQREGGQVAWKPRFAPDGRLLFFEMFIPQNASQSQGLWQVYAYDSEHDFIFQLAAGEIGGLPQD